MTQSLADSLAALRRPRLLIRAARFGLADYDRARILRRIFGGDTDTPPANTLAPLIEREAEFEQRRRDGDAGYSVARHVELLIALMGEARRVLTPAPLA